MKKLLLLSILTTLLFSNCDKREIIHTPERYRIKYFIKCKICEVIYFDEDGTPEYEQMGSLEWNNQFIIEEGNTVGFEIKSNITTWNDDEIHAWVKVDDVVVQEVNLSKAFGDEEMLFAELYHEL